MNGNYLHITMSRQVSALFFNSSLSWHAVVFLRYNNSRTGAMFVDQSR